MSASLPPIQRLNPSQERYWQHSPSISLVSRSFEGRMFPLPRDGLDRAMRELVR